MTDNGLAALAAALYAGDDALRSMAEARGAAAAILGERGLFLPDGHGLCGIQDAMTITEQAATIATLRAALDRLACYADAASDCPYPMHDPEKCDHRYILREEATLARAALATAKEAGRPTLPPPDLDLIENSDGNGNRWPLSAKERADLRAALVAYVATCSAESDQQVSATKEATT
jgi:hypothetical protein